MILLYNPIKLEITFSYISFYVASYYEFMVNDLIFYFNMAYCISLPFE